MIPGYDARRAAAFTLVEMLVAIAILAMLTVVTHMVFSTVTRAWQRGVVLTDRLQHGDFVAEQLVDALRAARWRSDKDGFWLEEAGDAPEASDVISWVKTGAALVGEESDLAKTVHRIRFFVGPHGDAGRPAALFTAWGDEYLHGDDFDPEELTPVALSDKVVGFNCRVATNAVPNEGVQWLDEWKGRLPDGQDLTNRLPIYVELTLYLEPPAPGEPPVEMKRCVEITVARRQWKAR